MAFWTGWSDGKKWFMGMMASVLTTALIAAGNSVLTGSRSHRREDSDLTRKARLVVEHVGNLDPLKEGFELGKSAATAEQLKDWDSIVLAPAQLASTSDPPAWFIANPVIGAVPYIKKLSDQDAADAKEKGWRITLVARLVEQTSADGGIHANFDTGYLRYDVNILRASPQHPENTRLIVRLNSLVGDLGKRVEGWEGGTNKPIDGDRSHKYVMTYNSGSKSASVYVDDELLFTQNYPGHHDYTLNLCQFHVRDEWH